MQYTDTTDVYVIHSKKPITEIKAMFDSMEGEKIKYIRIIYKSFKSSPPGKPVKKEKDETKKTIVFCSANCIKRFKETYPEYEKAVAAYKWDTFPMPCKEIGETHDLHISGIPCDYTQGDADNFIKESLACVLQKEGNFTTEFNTMSRETGEIKGYGKIMFYPHVPFDKIKLCKLVLHNTKVSFKTEKTRRMVTCVWHKTKMENTITLAAESVRIIRPRPTVFGKSLSSNGNYHM